MRRLVPGLVVCLVALSLTVLALVFVTSPASRDDNGVGMTPAMGWSSWSFLRDSPTEASIEADAKAMKDSGLASVGYQYVNLDDFSNPSLAGPLACAQAVTAARRPRSPVRSRAEEPHGVGLNGQRTSVYSLRSSRTTLV
jgi:hypothetical protein